jgi:hypothetical protein
LAEDHEFFDAYWKTKRVDFSKIKIPSYILGSYSSALHTVGAVRAFREIDTDKKWFRIHPHQEWYEDYYAPSVDDLDRFFERYLKGIENGWEVTPKVRVSLYRYGETVYLFLSDLMLRVLYMIKSKPITRFRALNTRNFI